MYQQVDVAGSTIGKGRHVAIVANTAWYLYNFRSNLIRLLVSQGWKVSLIAPFDEYYTALEEMENVLVYRLRHLNRKGYNPFQDIRLYRAIRALYHQIKPDVVLQYTVKPNIYGSMAARQLGIPTISVVPGLGYAFIRPGLLRSIVTVLYRQTLRANRYVIFENTEDMNELIGNHIIEQARAVVFNGCGIDTEHFSPLPSKTNSDFRFLFIGRLIKEKGVAEFVQAAHHVHLRFPKARFYIAGNIDTENRSGFTHEEVKTMTDFEWIQYLGFVQDVRQAIREADCVVLPSYYPEGLPRVLLESMSMGKPVISTNSRGCRDAIEDGRNGFLINPRDSHDLSSAMITFCELPEEERKAMGQYGRMKAISEFDDRIINAKYLELLEAVIV